MADDKSSKVNGLNTDPLQRLASIKPPRDLSLGGIKPNKKVFTPNLNVARNKTKGPSSANRDQKKDDKRNDRKNIRNRNFRNGPSIIKSSGVFSEGLGSAERNYSRSAYSSRDTDAGGALKKPTIRVKDVIKIDKELEEQKIRSVIGDTGNAEDDASVDFKQLQERDAPIKLPMDYGRSNGKPKSALKVKEEIVVKTEPEDECIMEVEEKPLIGVKTELFENSDVVKLLRGEEPTLILLQLPDSLPGRGGGPDDEAPRRHATKNSEPSTSSSSGETKGDKPVDNKCQLKDLEEGRIGKLMVHRSGRVTLKLGDTIFEVSMGTKAAFHQEVVSVATDDASRSANLVALGALQHKLNLLPDWEDMFKDFAV